ncbi:hypothetical protein B1R32_101101 [Abditibacterium utsteinense]|uniref:Uncharacterized protein n=1 Tax=Abditibacterium utsteinense TaxID=1960156 RepID=A0A2S8SX34_9BACT|nr:hypothetical protein [Abditibacterium utsteinense]PQV65361.1 hypothetical protein B1R32_101101 [Abditibacterium utsteinense]
MNKIILPVALLLGFGVTIRISSSQKLLANELEQAPTTLAVRSNAANFQQTEWIVKSLQEMETIKVGMNRAQLAKVFTTEGGLSTRTWRRYVYRECPYIKVNVEFKPDSKGRSDVITKIPQPFLEWSIMD